MKLLSDPRLFNFVIMGLYTVNSIRWLYAGKWGDAAYWFSAFCITASVTWGYKH